MFTIYVKIISYSVPREINVPESKLKGSETSAWPFSTTMLMPRMDRPCAEYTSAVMVSDGPCTRSMLFSRLKENVYEDCVSSKASVALPASGLLFTRTRRINPQTIITSPRLRIRTLLVITARRKNTYLMMTISLRITVIGKDFCLGYMQLPR